MLQIVPKKSLHHVGAPICFKGLPIVCPSHDGKIFCHTIFKHPRSLYDTAISLQRSVSTKPMIFSCDDHHIWWSTCVPVTKIPRIFYVHYNDDFVMHLRWEKVCTYIFTWIVYKYGLIHGFLLKIWSTNITHLFLSSWYSNWFDNY